MTDSKIIVGRFGAVFGLQGWIKVFSYTNPPLNILEYSPWFAGIHDNWEKIEITEGKPHSKSVIVQIAGYSNCEQIAKFVNWDIAVEQCQLPPLAKGEYYWRDLEGMKVINLENEVLGTVDHLLETGANDVIVTKGKKRHLIPYISSVIVEVDSKKRIIKVDWDSEF